MKNYYDFGFLNSKSQILDKALSHLSSKEKRLYKNILEKLIECIIEIQSNGSVSDKQYELLMEGLEQPLELVFDSFSGSIVSKLSHVDDKASEAFKELALSRKWKHRFNAVTLMLCRPKTSVINYVLSTCINDKSKKVRMKVSDVVERLNYESFLEQLKKTLRN